MKQELQEIELSKIVVKSNPRKDFGNMDELTASVRLYGVLEPVLLNGKNELLAGERRLRAAKAAGLEKIPCRIINASEEEAEIKLVENLQRKDLTLMEEAKAFQNYIVTTKKSYDRLAGQISKPLEYVNRRIMLLKLTEACQKELSDGKISLGHATILAQLTPEQQAICLKTVAENKYSVKEFATFMAWNKNVNLQVVDAQIELPKGKGVQTVIEGDGVSIPHGVARLKAFAKEVSAYLAQERGRFQSKGIQVFGSKASVLKKFPKAEELQSWEEEYKSAVKTLPGSKDYAVVVENEGYSIDKSVFRLSKRVMPKSVAKISEKDRADTEKLLGLSRKQKLVNRLKGFKREFNAQVTMAKAPGRAKNMAALRLYGLLVALPYGNFDERKAADVIFKAAGTGKAPFGRPDVSLRKIRQLPDGTILKLADDAALLQVPRLWNGDLETAAEAAGVRLDEDFKLTDEFLKLYSKDQLVLLAKEFSMKLESKKGKDMRAEMLKAWKKGQVPKALEAVK